MAVSLPSFEQFKAFKPGAQCKLTRNKGKLLLSLEDLYYGIDLYAVGRYYVELWYNLRDQKIFRVGYFRTTERLDPYLKRISLPEI